MMAWMPLAASIREFGFRQPIVVDEDGVIIVGHTRWKAAQNWASRSAGPRRDGLTPEQIRPTASPTIRPPTSHLGLRPAAARTGRAAELLTSTWACWVSRPTNSPSCWVEESQDGLTDPDDIPAARRSDHAAGDLWILGDHRLLCGDSSKAEDVDRLLDGATIHLVNTDPPYNVKVEPRSNNAIAAGLSSFEGTKHHQALDLARHPKKSKPTQKKLRAKDRRWRTTSSPTRSSTGLLDAWFGNMARVLEPGRGFYIWGGYANCGNYPPVLKAKELYFSQAIIWERSIRSSPARTSWATTNGASTAGEKARPISSWARTTPWTSGRVKKINPQQDGPPDREASRTGRAGDPVLVARR